MTLMTVGWARAENAADLPRDSGIVFPPPLMTIGWKPMLNTSVLDWEARPEPGRGPGGSER